MNSTYRDINRQAILYADGGELYRAQCLLRQNVKRHRCLTTLNNLAVFYCENNAVDQNERERDGKWLALHYFEQALALEPTDKTFLRLPSCIIIAARLRLRQIALKRRLKKGTRKLPLLTAALHSIVWANIPKPPLALQRLCSFAVRIRARMC